jgi:hypothetical protein
MDRLTANSKTQVNSGAIVDLINPLRSTVNINDIARALSNTCRFNGHTSGFYSVAQHCVIVSAMLREQSAETQMWGLLHDAHEAYIGDITAPVQTALGLHVSRAFSEIRGRFDTIIRQMAGVVSPDYEAVATADIQLLLVEKRDILERPDVEWSIPDTWPAAPDDFHLCRLLTPLEVEPLFLEVYQVLLRKIQHESLEH